jgi:hypothetical protein
LGEVEAAVIAHKVYYRVELLVYKSQIVLNDCHAGRRRSQFSIRIMK